MSTRDGHYNSQRAPPWLATRFQIITRAVHGILPPQLVLETLWDDRRRASARESDLASSRHDEARTHVNSRWPLQLTASFSMAGYKISNHH